MKTKKTKKKTVWKICSILKKIALILHEGMLVLWGFLKNETLQTMHFVKQS